MGGALFQYGTAVHLALLTAAPLFLSAFCGPTAEALVLFWLSLLGAIWVVMNPSPRSGEWPRDARHRICWEIGRDPILIFFVVALILSFIRAVNGGIAMVYDTGTKLWVLKNPVIGVLPGSVSGKGVVPLFGVLSLSVVTLGVRHALGARARLAYLLVASALSALSVGFWFVLAARGALAVSPAATATNPFALSSFIGVVLLFSLVACVEVWKRSSPGLELVAAIIASGVTFGFVRYAPPFQILVFGSLGLLAAVGGIVFAGFQRKTTDWLRAILMLTIVVGPSVLWLTNGNRWQNLWPILPTGFVALRDAATSVAMKAWRSSTQLGVGVGAFPDALNYFASDEVWQAVSPFQTAAPYGWAHFLFERGLLGSSMLLIGLGLLLKDILVRFIRANSRWSLSATHLLAAAVLLAVTAVMFVDCSFTQLEMLSPVCASLALTAADIPDPMESKHG